MSQHQPFYKSTFYRSKGAQYGDQLYLRSLCSVVDTGGCTNTPSSLSSTASLTTVPIQAALPPSTTSGIPLVYGSQAFTKTATDAAFSVRLWSGASPTLQEAFQATPTTFRVPQAVILGDWRFLPTGDGGVLLFQQWSPAFQDYVTVFTSDDMKAVVGLVGDDESSSLVLGTWRIQALNGTFEIQVLENGQYVTKQTFRV